MQNRVKHEGRGFFSVWLNGEVVDTASNKAKAQVKFEMLKARAERWGQLKAA
jgi:hypothetical protein